MSEEGHSGNAGVADYYGYFINLDERGMFRADLRTQSGSTVMNVTNECFDENDNYIGDGEISLVEDGFMSHGRDIDGLLDYVIQVGLIAKGSKILESGEFENHIDDDSFPSLSSSMRLG